MIELRIILGVAGLLFIAGIAAYEWWRARRDRLPVTATVEDHGAAEAPAIAPARTSLPEINVVRDARVAVSDDLPVIELASASDTGTRRALGISISDEIAVDVLAEPTRAEAARAEPTRAEAPRVDVVREQVAKADAPARHEPYIGQDDEIGEVRVIDEQPVRGPQIVLSWPSEAERRIVTLRLVPRSEPRFAGRVLRQAFASAGFWHGPMDIFHLPDEAGRVVVSAAALAQPGTFDPSIMDSQRFSGLNLFAVLPGPMNERDAFEALIGAARAMAERLEGKIVDQHGEELTQARIARLRQSLEGPPQARVAGEG